MIRSFSGRVPKIHPKAFVHDSAEVIGKVTLGAEASVFPGCVLRGDIDEIKIGSRSNIQDQVVIHTRDGQPTVIGRGVTVGHRAVLHGCRIGDRVLVGMGAIIMEATIGARTLIGAGALVPAGAKIPSGVLVLGSPAKVVRKLRPEELKMLVSSEKMYVALARAHKTSSKVVFGL
ncbi:MAG: gamma carbonic anhydrase family protein [Elusimicrobiota bacterium]|nr:MAG: gamma carbonic anhydrase family protein [Elusimicrobiota bacterium]